MKDKVDFGSATGSKISRYELIPKVALECLSGRFEVGLERHKEKAWNALSENRHSALTKEWVMARMAHAVEHAMDAIQKINSGQFFEPGFSEDDAGAIMFAGAVLAAYIETKFDQGAMTKVEFMSDEEFDALKLDVGVESNAGSSVQLRKLTPEEKRAFEIKTPNIVTSQHVKPNEAFLCEETTFQKEFEKAGDRVKKIVADEFQDKKRRDRLHSLGYAEGLAAAQADKPYAPDFAEGLRAAPINDVQAAVERMKK